MNESQFIDDIKQQIEYPLAALVSRLRHRATHKLTTAHIDEARILFQEALATAIVSTIKKMLPG